MGLGDEETRMVLHFLGLKDMSHISSQRWSASRSSCSLTQSAGLSIFLYRMQSSANSRTVEFGTHSKSLRGETWGERTGGLRGQLRILKQITSSTLIGLIMSRDGSQRKCTLVLVCAQRLLISGQHLSSAHHRKGAPPLSTIS